jgi:hypothetical protein
MKRVNEIIKAFGAWWPRLPPADRDRARLVVAGHLPDPGYYDPVACARNSGVAGAVDFRGYMELDEFERELASCSLVFNLRFPSCGETSGILHRLRDMRIPVATSAYASFHEEAADFRCSVHPDREQADIVRILEDSWAAWKFLGSTSSLVKARPPVAPKMKAADAFREQCEQMKERGYTYE